MIECDKKVSVLISTYNQKKYIARTLNSALMQKTDFNNKWKFIAHYFIDDKILDFVEQYKTKRNHDKIPHYTSEMTFGTRPSYKIVL